MGPGTELASNSFGVDSGERSGPAFTRLRAGRPNFGCYATPRNQPMSRWNSVPNLFKTANSPSWLLVIWRLAKRKPRESSREESRFHQLSGVKSPFHSLIGLSTFPRGPQTGDQQSISISNGSNFPECRRDFHLVFAMRSSPTGPRID